MEHKDDPHIGKRGNIDPNHIKKEGQKEQTFAKPRGEVGLWIYRGLL